MTNSKLRDALADEIAARHGITAKNCKQLRAAINQQLGLYWFPSHRAWLALDDYEGIEATHPKRQSDPNWRSRPSQSTAARVARNALSRSRRNEVAREMGYSNSGELLAAISVASEDIRQQVANLLKGGGTQK